MKISDYTK